MPSIGVKSNKRTVKDFGKKTLEKVLLNATVIVFASHEPHLLIVTDPAIGHQPMTIFSMAENSDSKERLLSTLYHAK